MVPHPNSRAQASAPCIPSTAYARGAVSLAETLSGEKEKGACLAETPFRGFVRDEGGAFCHAERGSTRELSERGVSHVV